MSSIIVALLGMTGEGVSFLRERRPWDFYSESVIPTEGRNLLWHVRLRFLPSAPLRVN
jgi:hypothetical protein